jgi:copper chaperone
MTTLKFKTNINCGGCIKSVTPHLDKAEGVKSWQVDTANPEKILTVEADGTDAQKVRQVVEKAGFKAEAIA